MGKLKITAFLADGKTLYKSHYPSADEVPDREWFPGLWRFYGTIRELGVCQGFATNCEELGIAADKLDYERIEDGVVTSMYPQIKRREMRLDGIVDVEVEGIKKPCKGYFWAPATMVSWDGKDYPMWDQEGLVVYADDKKANAEALALYKAAKRDLVLSSRVAY